MTGRVVALLTRPLFILTVKHLWMNVAADTDGTDQAQVDETSRDRRLREKALRRPRLDKRPLEMQMQRLE